MQYLVLRQFTTLGRTLKKGTVVDESEIRSPRLRQSEGKIIPAVSSFNVPAESDDESLASQESERDVNTEGEAGEAAKPEGSETEAPEAGDSETDKTDEDKPTEEKQETLKFSLRK